VGLAYPRNFPRLWLGRGGGALTQEHLLHRVKT
jgi:hypothetical protein